MDKIILYKKTNCSTCDAAKFVIARCLSLKNIDYSSVVEEKFVDTSIDANVEMMMLDSLSTPVAVIGETVLKEKDAANQSLVSIAIEKWALCK